LLANCDMSNPRRPSGKGKILRRTFLFLIGILIARQLTIFLSVAQNRSNLLDLTILLTQKLTAWLSSLKTSQAPHRLPSGSVKLLRI
jgi:hypothetical protein